MANKGKARWIVGGVVIAGAILGISFLNGTPPDMFKEGQGVVVEGRISTDGQSLAARNLMVKHSEEYKKPGAEHSSMDKELLEKSLFKGQQSLGK